MGQDHHHHRRHVRGFGYFKDLGPGLITGASDDDPSGIGTYSQAGAAFRFDLLWTAWVTFPLAAAVQETTGRLALTTGKGLAALLRERFPRWILYNAVALVTVANVVNIGADLGAMAASLKALVPLPFVLWLALITGVTTSLELFVPYKRYAKILRWLCLSLGSYIVVMFLVKANWAEVAQHAFIPVLHGDRAYHATIIAILGTTISPYLFFWQASEEVEEQALHHEHAPVDAKHFRAMRNDTISGMFSAVAVMFAIMVSSGATLGAQHITTVATADQAAAALEPLAGRFAGLLFMLGIVGTGMLAVPVLAGSAAYAISEAVGWREGLSQKVRGAPGFYGVIVVAMVVGAGLDLLGVNPIRALFLAAILNGLAAPPLIVLLLILCNSRSVVGEHRSGWLSNALVGAAIVLMTIVPLLYFFR